MLKVPEGGWVTLVIALVIFLLLIDWWFGEARLQRYIRSHFQGFPIPTLHFHLLHDEAHDYTSTSGTLVLVPRMKRKESEECEI